MYSLALNILLVAFAADPGPRPDSPARALRIIANAPSNVEIVCALGAGEQLVGVSSFVTWPETVRNLPRVGGLDDPDLEKILALKPDLLLQRGHNEHVEALCARHGIRMYVDTTDSLPSLYMTIADIGELLGRKQEAEALVESIRAPLNKMAMNPANTRPKVLLALRSPDRLTPLTTVGEGSFLHDVIFMAGGDNVFGDEIRAYPEINLEDVIARQPEIIIDAMPGSDLDAEAKQRISAQWSVLRTVPAVRQNAIHVLTEDYVLTPSPRVVLLAEKLHALFNREAPAQGE